MSLPEILASAEPLEDGFRTAIPPDWQQGRTAYGGLSSAIALAAAMQVGGEELPPLRSAQISMIAPLYGDIEVRAKLVRRGKNATWISSEITSEQGTALTASLVFMGPVSSPLELDERKPPDALIPVEEAKDFINENAPVFLRTHFDIRFALPKTTEKRPELCWWVRARERDGLDPMVELMLVGDAMPPGVMPLLTPRIAVSTMQWHCNLLTALPATRDGWWLLRSSADYAQHGCSSEPLGTWNADLEPMMASTQSVAFFG